MNINQDSYQKFWKILGFMPPKMPAIYNIAVGKICVDIVKLNGEFTRRDIDYNGDECMYKCMPYSLESYVMKKYGEEAVNLMNDLIG